MKRILLCTLFVGGCTLFTGPDDACESRLGVSVCVNTVEIAPGRWMHATISNQTSETKLMDTCAPQVAGRQDERAEFLESFVPARRCGFGVTIQEVLDKAIPIPPGGSTVDSFLITVGAPQGQYRRSYWFLLPDGSLEYPTPFASPVFDVFPSADPPR